MSLPYYRWFPGDYIRDTRRLSMLQHGAYRLLIDEYMVTGKPLPNDLPALYRVCGAVSGEEHAAVRYVLEEFFRLTGPVWRHKRCDEEIGRQSERTSSAQASAGKRWSRKGGAEPVGDDANAYANALPTHSERICERNASQSQNQNQRKDTDSDARASVSPVGLAVVLRKAGVQCNGSHPTLIEMAAQGVSAETLLAAVDEARRATGGTSFNVTYLARIVSRWASESGSMTFSGAAPPAGRSASKGAAFLAALDRTVNDPGVIDVKAAAGRTVRLGR